MGVKRNLVLGLVTIAAFIAAGAAAQADSSGHPSPDAPKAAPQATSDPARLDAPYVAATGPGTRRRTQTEREGRTDGRHV